MHMEQAKIVSDKKDINCNNIMKRYKKKMINFDYVIKKKQKNIIIIILIIYTEY